MGGNSHKKTILFSFWKFVYLANVLFALPFSEVNRGDRMKVAMRVIGPETYDTVGEMMVDFMNEVAPQMRRRPDSLEYARTAALHCERSGQLLGAFGQGDELVGFMCMAKHSSLISAGLHLEISELYVRPNFRNLGIGAKFIERALEFCHDVGIRRIVLSTGVADLNQAPNSFYKRHGFEFIGPYLRKTV